MKKFLFLLIAISFSFSIRAQLDTKEKNAAMAVVTVNQKSLGLENGDLNNMEVINSYVDQQSGIRYVYLIQTYKDIPVYNQLQVLSFKGNKLLSKAGGRIPQMEEKTKGKSSLPKVSASSAVLAALTDRKITGAKNPVAKMSTDNNRKIEFDNLGISRQNITAKMLWVPDKNGQNIHLAWQVFVAPNTSPDAWLVSVDAENSAIVDVHNFTNYDHWGKATDNKVMEPTALSKTSFNIKNNLSTILKASKNTRGNEQLKSSTVDGATYRVIPFPSESPIASGGAPALVTNPWTMVPGNATTLKWHTGAGGIDYNYTRGNNVWAYQDRENNDIGTIVKSASSLTNSATLNFDFAPDLTADPTQTGPIQNQQFAITNLFYWNNIIHDVMYQYGFTEAAANFQEDNLGRGGLGHDLVNAQAQDGGGLNNANFSAPPDGYPSQMQMYLWEPQPVLHVNTPTSLAGNYTIRDASPYNLLANLGQLSGDVVLYESGGANQGCGAPTNDVHGKIALINAGGCDLFTKGYNAQISGAIAVIIINDQPNLAYLPQYGSLTLPTVFISSTDGQSIANNLTNGVNVTLSANAPYVDGDLDNAVVVHEYGHGISNRLTGGGTSTCLSNAEQMGEGWSDYYALMLTQNWANSDLNSGFTNPRGYGNYSSSSSSGSRSHKYCTDFSVNSKVYLSSLPSEPHDRGEIWGATLWEMTWAIIQQEGINPNIYQPAGGGGNTIAMKLVTEGMKLQSCSPGFTDGRDAIIQADRNLFGGTHLIAIKEAFRKRGMGFGASEGSSNSVTDQTPSFAFFPSLKVTSNLTDFITCIRTTSQEQTISVEGRNLTHDLVITAPYGFEISNVSGTNFNSSLTVPATNGVVNATIYIRLISTNINQSGTGNLLFASTDADDVTIPLNGIVNTYVVPIFYGLPNALCSGLVAPLLPSISDNGIQGTWNPSVVSNTASGTYTFTPPGAPICASFQTTITVKPLPTVSFSGLPASICLEAAAVTLTGSPAGGSFYLLTLDTSAIIRSITNIFNPATVGTGIKNVGYLFTAANGCSSFINHLITVTPLPIISGTVNISTTQICSGSNYTVTYTGGIANSKWQSYDDATAKWYDYLPTDNHNPLPLTALYPSSTSNGLPGDKIRVKSPYGDCSALSNVVEIGYLPLPSVSFTGLPTSICANGGSVTLTGTPTGGIFTGSGISGSSFNPATAALGYNTITYTYSGVNGCKNISSHIITVNPLPSVGFSGLPTSICVNGGSVTLTGSPTGGIFNGNGINGNSFNPTTAALGYNTITYTYTGLNGCINSSSQTIIVNPLPSVSFSGLPSSVCINAGSITLTGSPTGGIFNINGNDIIGNTFNPATAATGNNVITYTFSNASGCSNSSSQTITVNPLTVITGNPADQTIYALNNSSYSVSATGTGTLGYQWQLSTDGGINYSNLTDNTIYSGSLTSTLSLTNVPITMNGYKYRCVVTGLCSIATSTSATLTVNKRPTVITYTGDNNEQYSDVQNLTAALKDQQTNAVLSIKTINFTLGTQSATGITNASGIASSTLRMYQNVGSYNVASSFAGDGTYEASSDTRSFNITKENAVTDYTGPEFISVPCTTCATTTIFLTASVRDTTAVYPTNDIYPGDIRKARVKFVNLNTMADISGWLTPGLVSSADTTSGIVSYSWTVALPSTSYDVYSVGVVVDNNGTAGNYIGKSETVISVSRSALTEFITGGGNVIPVSSAGSYASDAGNKLHFGFNVKYTKSGTNLQGNMNVIYRRAGRVYQIKATSLTSLSITSINPCSKKAIFSSKANLTDITNPVLPISIYGGITLQVTMTDNGEPGITDLIGIMLLNGNSLVYSSNWVSTSTQELLLNRGNIKVQNGVDCSTSNILAKTPVVVSAITEEAISTTSIKAYPNPFINHTIIRYTLNEAMQTSLTVYDSKGLKLAQLVNGRMSAGMHEARLDGTKLAAGVYIYLLETVDAKGRMNTLNGKLVVQR